MLYLPTTSHQCPCPSPTLPLLPFFLLYLPFFWSMSNKRDLFFPPLFLFLTFFGAISTWEGFFVVLFIQLYFAFC
ncbi:hypothetical protein J3E71DRAFT_21482 [Bipolaris maydis]|nr:hypothetical protein J3E71DRAFT_21482 [Bipolaris maydis]